MSSPYLSVSKVKQWDARFFLPAKVPAPVVATPFLRPSSIGTRILRLLEDRPEITSREASAILGCYVTSASHALEYLSRRGLLRIVRPCIRGRQTLPAVYALNRTIRGGGE